jgi:helicase
MNADSIKGIPKEAIESMSKRNISKFLPAQIKAIEAGLLENKNLLICTPTASGKTLIAEIAITKTVVEKRGKAIYLVPLKALAEEKYKELQELYPSIKIAISIGDTDSADNYLERYDLIIMTSEKLDSVIRHNPVWFHEIKLVVVDEIHLLHDNSRGPTLEIVITILKEILKEVRIIGLSATIGNPKELAEWLKAELVIDNWRPVELKKGIRYDGKTEFY